MKLFLGCRVFTFSYKVNKKVGAEDNKKIQMENLRNDPAYHAELFEFLCCTYISLILDRFI